MTFNINGMVINFSKSGSKKDQDLINYEMNLMGFCSFLAKASDAVIQYLFNLRAKYLIAVHL